VDRAYNSKGSVPLSLRIKRLKGDEYSEPKSKVESSLYYYRRTTPGIVAGLDGVYARLIKAVVSF